MANPAELLLTQFQAWGQHKNSATTARSPQDNLWLTHRQALKHLEAIEQLLNEMDGVGRNTAVYRRYLPNWYDAVFAFPRGWEPQGSAQIDVKILEHLETLADVLANYVSAVQEGGLDSIRAYAEQVSQTLSEDGDIPDLLRLHAAEVVAHLIWCVDQYSLVGDFQLQDALERLAATVLRVAATTSPANREKMWGPVMSNWVWPFATNLMAAIPSQVLVMLALGSGT